MDDMNTDMLPGHAIGIRIFNPEDQAVLYVDQDVHGHQLTCEITNVSEQVLVISALPGGVEAGPEAHHFVLRFRRGLLHNLENLHAVGLGAGWVASAPSDEPDGVVVYYRYTGTEALEVAPRRFVSLGVAGAQANVNRGARTTRVELVFRELRYQGDEGPALQGERIHLLNVVNHTGHRFAPVFFHWSGTNQVLNNGSEQVLQLEMLHTQHDRTLLFSQDEERPTKLIFSLDKDIEEIAEDPEATTASGRWNRGIKDKDISSDYFAEVDFQLLPGAGSTGGNLDREQGHRVLSAAASAFNVKELAPRESLKLTLKLRTRLPADVVYLRVHYENLPGYWDSSVLLPIEVTPMIFSEKRVGIGLNNPQVPLEVQADSDLDIGLSVKGRLRSDAGEEGGMWVDSEHKAFVGRTKYSLGFWITGLKWVFNLNLKNGFLGLGHEASYEPKHRLEVKGDVKATGDVMADGNLNVSGKVQEGGHDLLPQGAIIMWSGSKIPEGWALCDGGGAHNPNPTVRTLVAQKKLVVPDLRDRFIVGAGGGYQVGNNGGQDEVKLSQKNMPPHTHTGSIASNGNHEHRIEGTNAGGLGWRRRRLPGQTTVNMGFGGGNNSDPNKEMWRGMIHTENTGSHTHGLTINSAGDGHGFDNRPKYFALAFIMKL